MILAVLVTVLGVLATARLTRLIAADRVLLPLRRAIVNRFGPSSALGYFVHCRWCVSLWIAPPVAAGVLWLWDLLSLDLGRYPWPAVLLLGAFLALTFSHLTALLAGLEDED